MNKVRLLRPSDIPDCMELSNAAGWNQTPADWERILTLAPDACFGIEIDGHIISTTTAIRYAQELAWIGMVLTHPNHRGKGYARAAIEHAIRHTRAAGVRWIKLDATKEGQPLYTSLGFQEEYAVERWKREAGAQPVITKAPQLNSYVVDPSFDRAYFGALRVPLLNSLLKEGATFVVGYGYAMGRPGALADYFGPCVVRTRDAARQLLHWFLANHQGRDIFWDLIPDNSDAVQLAIDHGFHPVRQLVRMALPGKPGEPPMLRNNTSIFAIAGFEYG
jgi:GNAT superfamily N-acetyltransferase